MTTLNDVENKNVNTEPEHSEGTCDGSLFETRGFASLEEN